MEHAWSARKLYGCAGERKRCPPLVPDGEGDGAQQIVVIAFATGGVDFAAGSRRFEAESGRFPEERVEVEFRGR